MMMIIVADVALRNIAVPGMPRGLAWSNEVSELMLYLITVCVAPWLLRRGQHIRVDILLQALPRRLAWLLEWIGDTLGLACCLFMAWYGANAAWASYASGREHQDAGDARVVVAALRFPSCSCCWPSRCCSAWAGSMLPSGGRARTRWAPRDAAV